LLGFEKKIDRFIRYLSRYKVEVKKMIMFGTGTTGPIAPPEPIPYVVSDIVAGS